jgi:putative DNA-invertase from lambdoid prophage Rac
MTSADDDELLAVQLFAAAFAEAERDRIRERIGQSKADQKARRRYLGGIMPFGYRRGEGGELVPHEALQHLTPSSRGMTSLARVPLDFGV